MSIHLLASQSIEIEVARIKNAATGCRADGSVNITRALLVMAG
jgi:hypothetical protein